MTDREFWLIIRRALLMMVGDIEREIVRRALLMIVGAIERKYDISSKRQVE